MRSGAALVQKWRSSVSVNWEYARNLFPSILAWEIVLCSEWCCHWELDQLLSLWKRTRERERDIANMMCLRHSLLGIRRAFSRGTVLELFRVSPCGSSPVGKLKTKVLHTLLQRDRHPHQLFPSSYFLIGFQGWTPGLDFQWFSMDSGNLPGADFLQFACFSWFEVQVWVSALRCVF